MSNNYKQFIEGKMQYGANSGFEPLWMPDFLFDYQRWITDWAIRKGRAAIFADCGMGKTPMELVWAQNVIKKTNKPVLLLAPLAVTSQMLDEAERFGVEAEIATPGKHHNKPKIYITNYEKLHLFYSEDFAGVICDESSILKNHTGKRRKQITEFMRTIPYRLLGTATAAPNDWLELGTSSEAIGYLGQRDMLTKFFSRSQVFARDNATRKEYVMKPHAEKGPFWQWVASWAMAARKPSDLGFDDNGFLLPPLIENDVEVKANMPTQGMLFDVEATNFHEEREATRRTTKERCEMAAELIMSQPGHAIGWVDLNAEGDLLTRLIPGAVQVAGRHSDKHKIEAAQWFKNGSDEKRVLITKPKIFGFGLNFQHCHYMTYFPTHSYEAYYQATRRLWRFGQDEPVTVDRIFTNGGKRMLNNIKEKSHNADVMFNKLVQYMNDSMTLECNYTNIQNMEVPRW